jgi:ankyrin repeat protein
MKREAPMGELEQEAKIARVNLEPVLQDLPEPILKIIIANLTVARGATEKARLYKAAESLRSLLMTSSFFTKYLNDINFNGALIFELARRYTDNNIIEAAVALGTQAGGTWLKQLINTGIDNNNQEIRDKHDRDAIDALMQAVLQNQEGVARFLLYNYPGLSALIQDVYYGNGNTVLITAVQKKLFNMVKLLTEEGVDVNISAQAPDVNLPGSSPLSFAIGGDPRIIDLLLEADADVNAGGWFDLGDSFRFEVPIVTAMRVGDKYAFKKLLADPGININLQIAGLAPIMHAIEELDIESLHDLLRAGANPNIINPDPEEIAQDTRTPLLYTTRNLNPARNEDLKRMAELLLKYGADVNLTTQGNYTLLMLAALDRPDLVPLFIKAGANVNAQDDYGQTALTLAVRNGVLDTVEQLIRAGANVLHATKNGDTAFTYAAVLPEGPTKNAIIKLLEERRDSLGS